MEPTQTRRPDRLRLDAGTLQHVLDDVRDETGVPGLAACLLLDGATLAAFSGTAALGSDHPLGEQSRFEVSCLMKFYVSLLVLALAGERRLSLETPVSEYFPDLATAPALTGVKIRHLLSHTSGYRGLDITDARSRWGCNWPQLITTLAQSPSLFSPGTVFSYEHTEHVILGRVVERITGESAATLVRRRFFEPLGIKASTAVADVADTARRVAQHRYDADSHGYVPLPTVPFAPFWESSLPNSTATLSDHVRVTDSILRAATTNRQQTTTRVIQLPPGIPSGLRPELSPLGFSLACGDYGDGLYGHNGSAPGQTCAVRFHHDGTFVLAVGVNAWVPYARDRVVDRVVTLCRKTRAHLKWRDRQMRSFELSQLNGEFDPEQLPGHYIGNFHEQVDVRLEGEELRLQMGRAARSGPLIRIRLVSGRSWVPVSGQSPLTVGFFRHPQSGEPALMLGVHAYKKAS